MTLPAKLTGDHHLVMVGNDPSGHLKASVLAITIKAVPTLAPGATPDALALTGGDLFGLVIAAAVCIVAGTLATYRRRSPTNPAA